MTIGLNRTELASLIDVNNLPEQADILDTIATTTSFFTQLMIDMILKNNERIAKQLADAGINLPE